MKKPNICVYIKEEEKQMIERSALSLGLGLSAYIRMLAITDSRRVLTNLHKQEVQPTA